MAAGAYRLAQPVELQTAALSEQIELQASVTVTDPLGGRTQVWTTYATTWASVTVVANVESEEEALVFYLIGVRYRADVLTQQRVIVGGLTLKILAVENMEMQDRRLVLHCAAVQ